MLKLYIYILTSTATIVKIRLANFNNGSS